MFTIIDYCLWIIWCKNYLNSTVCPRQARVTRSCSNRGTTRHGFCSWCSWSRDWGHLLVPGGLLLAWRVYFTVVVGLMRHQRSFLFQLGLQIFSALLVSDIMTALPGARDFVCPVSHLQDCGAEFARLFQVWGWSCVLAEELVGACKLVTGNGLSLNLASQRLMLHPAPPGDFSGWVLMVFQGQQSRNQLWNI